MSAGPSQLENRYRKRWSRRLRLIGLSILAAYVGLIALLLFLLPSVPFILIVTGGGAFTVAVRHLIAAGHLERNDNQQGDEDPELSKLVSRYERKVIRDTQREAVGGTLSLPLGSAEGGEVSVVADAAGRLAETEAEPKPQSESQNGQGDASALNLPSLPP